MELGTMRTASIALMIVLLISFGSPVTAHHSAAGQDFTKRVEMDGVVKSWRIMNPHGKLVIQALKEYNQEKMKHLMGRTSGG